MMDSQPITPAERERLTGYLARSGERLLALTRGLTAAELDYKPAPDRWSIAECLEHLTVVENRVLGRIEAALGETPDPTKRSAWEGRDEELIRTIENRTPRVKAPELVEPKRQWGHEELFRQLEAARRRTLEFASAAHGALRSYLLPHPLFGELDCYQWLLAAAAHFERHRAQCEEILAEADFPRAGVSR
ncbi:MAG TPA: DinB family protein [Candidatus Acidoferrales bacterium]|nr:DinB family protein [Candidatus Acidoferrales bacterium]